MNKKLNYEAPEMEVVKVGLNTSILSISGEQAQSALSNSYIDDMTDYNSGNEIAW